MDEENPPSAAAVEEGQPVNNNGASQKDGGDVDGAPPPAKRNINSYYGHKIGFLQTLSLTLNAGLMVYAHVGLSAVIFSSRDPDTTAAPNTNTEGGGGTTGNGDGISTSTPPGGGKCNAQDLEQWITNGGESNRPTQSNYCSREYNDGGCLLDSECVETCFQEMYGYSEECSACFGGVPGCSVSNGCTFLW